MPAPPSLTHAPVDFVRSDFEALASHMRHCERDQGRWFTVTTEWERVRSLAAGRIVTLSCLALVVTLTLFVVA